MSQSKKILTINIGECGINMGHTILEQCCPQHGINKFGNQKYRKVGPTKVISDKYSKKDDSEYNHSILTCFKEIYDGQYTARNIIIDTEPNIIDDIKCSDYSALYDEDCFISGKEDAGNNFARGHFKIGNIMMDRINNKIRKSIENCDRLQGFIMNHSVAGGTGSGLGSLILQQLSTNYNKKIKVRKILHSTNDASHEHITQTYNK